MSKNIILCFDGTSNDPKGAEQDFQEQGAPVDNSLTNIAKLFLIFGGTDPAKANIVSKKQVCFYYSGVATNAKAFRRFINYSVAPQWLDVQKIMNQAGKDLKETYEEGDKLFLFGFSRGAALARRFASKLHDYITTKDQQPVKFMGVFDTVTAMGEVNLGKTIKTASDVVFENTRISTNIKTALHLLSLDEKRNAFLPTLMDYEPDRVREIWFAGAHSDVGGGYYHDGLSDIPLQFMLQEIDRLALGLKMTPPHKIDFEHIKHIDYDDVMIDPQTLAFSNHQTNFPIFHDHRKLWIKSDDHLPTVHHSVVERICGLNDYKPVSLKKVPHHVYYGPDDAPSFNGLSDHVKTQQEPLETLEVGDSKTVTVFACHKSNKTRLLLRAGEKYIFHMDGGDDWYDNGIKCTPGGWNRAEMDLGFMEIPIAIAEFRRRKPDANWFEVCGEIATTPGQDGLTFSAYAHRKTPFLISKSGTLSLFANDVPFMYGNNRGFIAINIERVE